MFKILVDTCVWLDLAKDYQQQALLAALEELIRQGQVQLILPRTVAVEFARKALNSDVRPSFYEVEAACEAGPTPLRVLDCARPVNGASRSSPRSCES